MSTPVCEFCRKPTPHHLRGCVEHIWAMSATVRRPDPKSRRNGPWSTVETPQPVNTIHVDVAPAFGVHDVYIDRDGYGGVTEVNWLGTDGWSYSAVPDPAIAEGFDEKWVILSNSHDEEPRFHGWVKDSVFLHSIAGGLVIDRSDR